MIYLNNAATSFPKAPGVDKAVEESLKQMPGHGNRASFLGPKKEEECRSALARLLQVEESRVVYAMNATHALNIGILGFPWREGDVVITTAAEHNAVLRPLFDLQKKGKIRYVTAPVDRAGRLTKETLGKMLKEYAPRMVVLTHASNVTGAVNDVAALTRQAKDAGASVFIDASQTAGLYNAAPALWGADLMALTGHKYLLGPQGTGALYVSPEIDLEPVFTGGTGIRSDEDEMPKEMPIRLEAGTQNDASFDGLCKALRWAEENPLDLETVLKRVERVEDTLRSCGCHPAEVKGERTPVISFTSPGYTPEDIGDMLTGSFDIVCRTGLHCAPLIFPYIGAGKDGTVRLSLSRFTTDGEIDDLVEALEEIFSEQGI